MKVLLLSDRESVNYQRVNINAVVCEAFSSTDIKLQNVIVDGDKIKPCRGCFRCWIKTPGVCILTDDGTNQITEWQIQADVVIVLTRITYGGYSYDIKSFLDRSIPNLSPYFASYQGEIHHKMRYARFPDVIFLGYGSSSQTEQQTFKELTDRYALNMRPKRHSTYLINDGDDILSTVAQLKDTLVAEVKR